MTTWSRGAKINLHWWRLLLAPAQLTLSHVQHQQRFCNKAKRLKIWPIETLGTMRWITSLLDDNFTAWHQGDTCAGEHLPRWTFQTVPGFTFWVFPPPMQDFLLPLPKNKCLNQREWRKNEREWNSISSLLCTEAALFHLSRNALKLLQKKTFRNQACKGLLKSLCLWS